MSVCITTSGFQMTYVPPPGPPLNLTASTSPGQINLTWSAAAPQPSTSIAKYILYRNDSGNWPPIGTSVGTTFTDTAVQPLTSYSYYVIAVDSRGAVSAQSNQVSIVSSGPLPLAPTNLAVTSVTSGSVTLSWGTAQNATTYNLYRNGAKVITGLTATQVTDTGLTASTTYTYTVTASNAVGEGPSSNSTQGTTAAAVTSGKFVFTPGNRVLVGYSNMPTLASIKSTCDGLFGPGGADVNHQIKGICLAPTWAQLEGAKDQYDGFGSESGFTKIAAVISLLKSYSPPRDLTIKINGGGNGYSPISSTAFQSSFCPSYMNVGAKGSPTDGYGGGEVHLQSDGVTPLDRPYIVIWNQNVVNREIALITAYNKQFGPDTAVGGIYRWDPYHEISVNANAPGYSVSTILAVFPSWMAGLRAAAPNTLIMVKPTFINPNNGASYGSTIVPSMFNNHISMSCEDCAPLHDWGMQAFLGMWASTPTNHAALKDWDYHCNVDPAELWNTKNGSAAIPPATYGPGLFYDVPNHPGIMTTVNQLNASHIDWYIDGFGGPPVVRRGYSGLPANPTPGPGAGSTASRPNIIDVLTSNMAYPGMISGGVSVPSTTYPPSYP